MSNQILTTVQDTGESQKGVVETATGAETLEGKINNKFVTPWGLRLKLAGDFPIPEYEDPPKFAYGRGDKEALDWSKPVSNDGSIEIKQIAKDQTNYRVLKAPTSPMPSIRFDNATVAKPNYCYWLIDPVIVTPAPLQLPERGDFKQDDEILVVNATGSTFKITIKSGSADIIRFDDQLIEDISGKFLLSEGPGSFVRLKALNGQMWVVIDRNRITVSSGG